MVTLRFAAVSFATALATFAAEPTASEMPRFEPAPCPFPADDTTLKQVRCGYVAVPENRAQPDSRRLKLAVAILKSSRPNPRPDPVVIVAGGPGEPFVSRAPNLIANGSMDILRADRDVILYDQRGAGFSEPAFCPELAAERSGARGTFASPLERRAFLRDMAMRCGESMRRAGYDLSQYNSVVSSHDLQDLRRALGYQAWNLHGRSYGSRLSLIAMRVAPAGIRSVVLDGPAPPDRAKWFNMPGDFTDVLKRLSDECASQPECNAAFPRVEQSFWQTIAALDREPMRQGWRRANGANPSRTITAAVFAAAMHGALERLQPAVPMLVHAVHTRNEALMEAVALALNRTVAVRAAGSPGMGKTVNCFEQAPLATLDLQQSARRKYSHVLTDEGVFEGPEGCDEMHPYRASPRQLAAVRSDIPTLILTGEFDLQTHRSNGPRVAASLQNSQLVEIPHVAHVQSFRHDCTRTIMRDFHDAPLKKVDTGCLASILPLRFVTDVTQLTSTTR